MTRATWDDDGTKYFETGIDRGMLYIPFVPGMVWNGLVKVTETPTGTAPREFYIDGEKYLNLPSLEEYAATIEAFSAPAGFATATGMKELAPGMLVTDQVRQAFGFSYRTLIGDDTGNLGTDYKIHIVYNAMAKTSDFTAQTTSGSGNSPTKTWSITTIAPQDSTPFRPTSHFIIDTRQIDQDVVAHIENVLYGTDTTDPRLPSVSELLAILSEVVVNVQMITKKMVVAAFGSVGGTELSIGTFRQITKKMRVAASGTTISSGAATIRTKKMAIDATGTTIDTPVPSDAPDLLPYLISTGAAAVGGLTLTMNVGDNGGWPALPGDTIIVCGGSGGAQPNTVTDSQGNSYTKQSGTNTPPASSIWSGTATLGAGGGGLQTADGPRNAVDTISVNYTGTGQAKQWIVFGCRNLGARDLAPASTSGTSAAPSISSGVPAVGNEFAVVVVTHANAGGAINTPTGWRLIAKNVTTGANAYASVFVKQRLGPTGVTFTASLAASTTWTCTMVTYRPVLTSLYGIVGGSIFQQSYPGELSPQDNWHAQLRFRKAVGRNTRAIKRYCSEKAAAASPTNDLEDVVGIWDANGLKCVISIKPRRMNGGGNATTDQWVRDTLTYWKNYGIDCDIIVGNESNIDGIHGPFGDGTSKDWQLPSPYTGVTTPAQAGNNYLDYFTRNGRIVVSAGYPAVFNPAISTQNYQFFVPPRLDTDGHPLLCGVSIDYYFAGDFSHNGITMRPVIASCDAMNPPCPVGIGELGVTDGKDRPLANTPAGSLADSVAWMDTEVTGQFKNRPANGRRNMAMLWYSNGAGNALEPAPTGPASFLKAFGRFFDSCDKSVATPPVIPPYKIGGAYVTSGTSRDVPVTKATRAGDTILIAASSNNSATVPTAATDSKGNLYTLDRSSVATNPTLSIFRSTPHQILPLGAVGGAGDCPTSLTGFTATNSTLGPLTRWKGFYAPGNLPTDIANSGIQGGGTPNNLPPEVIPILCFKSPAPNLASFVASIQRPVYIVFGNEAEGNYNGTYSQFLAEFEGYSNTIRGVGNPNVKIAQCSIGYQYHTGVNADVTSGKWKVPPAYVDAYLIDLYEHFDVQSTGKPGGYAWPSAGLANWDQWLNFLTVVNGDKPVGIAEYAVDLQMTVNGPGGYVGDPSAAAHAARLIADYEYLNDAFGPGGTVTDDQLVCWNYWYANCAAGVPQVPPNYRNMNVFTNASSIAAWKSFSQLTTNPLTAADKFTITMSNASNLLDALAIGIPAGVIDSLDVVPASIATGTSTGPSASATPTLDSDVAVALFASAQAAGAPAVSAPYTDLGFQQSGTGPYVSAGYRLLGSGTSGAAQTAAEVIGSSAAWKAILYLFEKAG